MIPRLNTLVAILSLSLVIFTHAEGRAAKLHEVLAPAPQGKTSTQVNHGKWDALIKRYIVADKSGLNRVDYRAWKSSGTKALRAYLKNLEEIDVRTLSRPQQFAYWVNLYNAKTIDVVLAHYPVRSIKRINLGGGGLFGAGPWSKKLVTISGHKLSLDDIEHNILRPGWRDKRIHYVVNCASVGCPNLPPRALNGANNNTVLETAARAYINHPRGVRIENGRIVASKIFKWYAEDFGTRAELIRHWRTYAKPGLKKALSVARPISRFDYDWTLNDTRR